MEFELRELLGSRLDEALLRYETEGFITVGGVADAVTAHFHPILAERLRVDAGTFQGMLDPNSPPLILPVETRERLSRITTSPELADTLLAALRPFFLRALGPFVQVSSTFHGQFKGGEVAAVDHGGYAKDYLEVQGQYLLHQDFAGAAIPTSPSAMTLWVGMNTTPDWNLRLYPGSHRYGLLCNEWLRLDDPRLSPFGKPIDFSAVAGKAVIFNALLLHSSSNPGPRRRISCDIRFFPLCGFLPSQPHCLDAAPGARLSEGLERAKGPTLRAPLLETLAYLGATLPEEAIPPHAMTNWAHYVARLVQDDPDGALPWMTRFVNAELGVDPAEVYAAKFHRKPIHSATIRHAASRLEPGHALRGSAERVQSRLAAGAA